LEVLREIRGLTYTKRGRREAGIGAQDLIETFEPALRGSEEEGYSVHYSALWAPAIEAVKTLDDRTLSHERRIEELEKEIEHREDRIATLEQKLRSA
jgi:predicted RNase H-like nuclease (RuvC/YqgF family)